MCALPRCLQLVPIGGCFAYARVLCRQMAQSAQILWHVLPLTGLRSGNRCLRSLIDAAPYSRAVLVHPSLNKVDLSLMCGLCGSPGAVPVTGHKQVDLPALYRQVGLHGGYDLVSEKKWWRNIGALLPYTSLPPSSHPTGTPPCMLSIISHWESKFTLHRFTPCKWCLSASGLCSWDVGQHAPCHVA